MLLNYCLWTKYTMKIFPTKKNNINIFFNHVYEIKEVCTRYNFFLFKLILEEKDKKKPEIYREFTLRRNIGIKYFFPWRMSHQKKVKKMSSF